MKKRIYIKRAAAGFLAAALALAALTGCAGSSENAGGTNDSAAADAKTDGTDSGQEVTVIHVATTGTPRPFTYYDDNNELTGHNVELIQAVFDRLPQYELELEVVDREALFAGLDSDKYQVGANNYGWNEEREEKYLFTDPIFANAELVVANKELNLSGISSFEDLADYTYVGGAGVNHTTLVENYNDENPDAQINITYTEEDINIQLSGVESGKYDFTLIDKPMFFGYYQPEFSYDVDTFDLEVSEVSYSYLLVSKGNEQLAEDINAALKEIYDDGTSKEICEKYFGGDYTPYDYYK